MQTIQNWLGKFNMSTHTLGIMVLALTAAFEGYKPFHDLVTAIYTGLPAWVQVLIGTGSFLLALYKTGALNRPAAQSNLARMESPGRSTSGQKLGALALCVTLLQGMVFVGGSVAAVAMTGCAISNAQIAADGAAVATALTGIADVYAALNPSAAAALKTSAADILAATANWSGTSGLALFNSAANAAEVVLASIPLTAPFAALIPIAVAAIDVLVANLNPAAVATAAVTAHALAAPKGNPYRGMVTINHRLLRSPKGDFTATWNERASALGYQQLILK